MHGERPVRACEESASVDGKATMRERRAGNGRSTAHRIFGELSAGLRQVKRAHAAQNGRTTTRMTTRITISAGISLAMRNWRSVSRASPRASFRSEEHTSELQSLMRNSYAVFCLKK